MTALGGMWLALTALFAFLTVTTEALLWVVMAIFSLLAAVICCVNPEAGRIAARVSVPTSRRNTAKPVKPGGKPRNARSRRTPGTPARKPSRCGARCRRSTKPAKTCDCVCRGSAHGSEAGRVYAGSRAEARSSALKRQEKQHVKEREQWRNKTPRPRGNGARNSN